MTTKKPGPPSVEAVDEGAVPDESGLAPDAGAESAPPEDEEIPKEGHQYQGPGGRSYPHHRNPETGNVLMAEPGDTFDFEPNSPPADGHWYNTSSGLPYTGADETSPAEDQAGQEEDN